MYSLFLIGTLVFSLSAQAYGSSKIQVELLPILKQALEKSDQAQIIKGQLDVKNAAKLQIDQLYQPVISSKLQFSNSRLDSTGGLFSPTRQSQSLLTAQARQQFSTGTSVAVDFRSESVNSDYPSAAGASSFSPKSKFSQSSWGLTIQQQLWRDFFGRASQSDIKSAELNEKLIVHQVNQSLEQLVISAMCWYERS